MPAAVTVIIPQYNGRRFLPRLMQSLSEQTRRDFDVVMVDDGSRDDGVAYVRSAWPQVRVIANGRNLGFAASVNVGLRVARTPFVALLNNDTHVDPHWLEEALAAFTRDDVGSAASLSLLARAPHVIDTAGDGYTVAGGAFKRLAGEPRQSAERVAREAFSASGVSAFYRRAALDEVGLLDESFGSYYEDIELGFRLQWRGWRCVFAPRSICFHHLSSSYSPRGWRHRYHSSRNAEVVWWSHLSPRLRRRYLAVHLFCLALQGVAEARRGHLPAWFTGKLHAMRMTQRIREKRAFHRRLARVDEETLLSRLERDWYAIHVGPKVRRVLHWLGAP